MPTLPGVPSGRLAGPPKMFCLPSDDRMDRQAGKAGAPAGGCALIVPVDLSRRPLSILRRLDRFLGPAGRPDGCTEVVIAHMDRGAPWDRLLRRSVRRAQRRGEPLVYAGARPLPHEDGIPLGRLRNIGVARARAADLLFSDVDLLLPKDVVTRARAIRAEAGTTFVSVPVVYLGWNARSATLLTGGSGVFRRRVAGAVRSREVDGVAINSSLILVARSHFLSIGAFDEIYCGHGFEDFDLLMRLALYEAPAILPTAVLVNRTSAEPARAVGFRSYLTRFTLPVAARGLFACHLHHWRPKGDGYFEARDRNYAHFCAKMYSQGVVSDSTPTGAIFDADETAAFFEHVLAVSDRWVRELLMAVPDAAAHRRLLPRLAMRCHSIAERLAVRSGNLISPRSP